MGGAIAGCLVQWEAYPGLGELWGLGGPGLKGCGGMYKEDTLSQGQGLAI